MLYLLRYADELRDAKSALSGVKESSVAPSELSLAKQLIGGSISKFELSDYKDDYEAALKKLVDAKRKGKPLSEPEPKPASTKVVNIMDALHKSLAEDKKPKRSTVKKTARGKKTA